jgi:hypothetical protein
MAAVFPLKPCPSRFLPHPSHLMQGQYCLIHLRWYIKRPSTYNHKGVLLHHHLFSSCSLQWGTIQCSRKERGWWLKPHLCSECLWLWEMRSSSGWFSLSHMAAISTKCVHLCLWQIMTITANLSWVLIGSCQELYRTVSFTPCNTKQLWYMAWYHHLINFTWEETEA